METWDAVRARRNVRTYSDAAVSGADPTIMLTGPAPAALAPQLPPVAQGDVLRALAHQPRLIGIIDGYFDTVPAVWHKEILYAMERGVHVFGASSIGALRAVELHDGDRTDF